MSKKPEGSDSLFGRQLADLPDLLTVEELSTWMQIPVSTLYQWNFKEVGPTPLKLGKHLRYPKAELERWLATLDRREWTGSN
ncbi:helix-turn-helix domain-containing protein [Microbacterium sp. NPDC089698]|uniref:helix-turn-helix domain-containing protein n=1 Tax=Microbacterium sp. NPDC089698 TaxID=3364200 RepID=UPI0037F90FF2